MVQRLELLQADALYEDDEKGDPTRVGAVPDAVLRLLREGAPADEVVPEDDGAEPTRRVALRRSDPDAETLEIPREARVEAVAHAESVAAMRASQTVPIPGAVARQVVSEVFARAQSRLENADASGEIAVPAPRAELPPTIQPEAVTAHTRPSRARRLALALAASVAVGAAAAVGAALYALSG